ncbi:patched family protein [Necator americanus]|uniref:Patched family protein n=1 Tax=Necator americanus TaxID=51031 RepID=W2SZX7_NECAM|nr:patched family protein [Necator americanus]ETN75295.1 patched family protein [Necator americanus]
MSLSTTCGRLGTVVGTRPLMFFLASIALFFISVLLLGAIPPEIRLSFDDGYTTSGAPSKRELQTQMEYFGAKGKPWYMALFAEPRDQENGSMTESKEYDEFKSFYKRIKTNIVIRQDGNRSITYMDYCGSTCDVNDQIFKTHGKDIVKSRLTALYFMAFPNNTQASDDLRHFEAIVSDQVTRHNADMTKVTTITQHGARGMQMEIARGMKFVLGKLIGGVFLAGIVTLICFVILNRIHGRSNGRVLLLSFGAMFLPLMSLISAAAFCSFIGIHTNTISVVAPALTFALGIDGMLILYNSWISSHKTINVKDRMSEVFASCFPSITIVSSAAIGLVVGGLFPIEEYAILSFYMGITIVFVYAYQMCFFPALMLWCSSVDTHSPLTQEQSKPTKLAKRPWSVRQMPFEFTLAQNFHRVVVLSGPSPSYIPWVIKDSLGFVGIQVWFEFFNVLYFIKKPPRFDDPSSYRRFKNMISEIESLPGNINKSAMMWINDFERHTGMTGNESALNMELFKEFITHEIYKAWNSGVRYRYEGDVPIITQMLYIGAYEGVKTMRDKANLLSQCRRVVANYPEFDVVPFDTDVGMVDVILQISYVAYLIPLSILIGISVVAMVFVGNLTLSSIVVISSILIFLGAKLALLFTILTLEHDQINDDVQRLTLTFRRMLYPAAMSAIAGSMVFFPMILTNVVIFRWLAVINLFILVAGVTHTVLVTPLILISLPSKLAGTWFFCTQNQKNDHVAMKSLST